LFLDRSAFLLFLAAHAYFVLVHPDLTARIVIFSLAMIFACVRGVMILGKLDPNLRRAGLGIFFVFTLFISFSLVRILIVCVLPIGHDLFSDSSFDSLIMVLYMTLFTAMTFSLVSLVGRRVYIDQQTAMEEKSAAEEALRSSEEKFAKAFRGSPDAISISRLDNGRFIDVNDSFCSISGYARDEILSEVSINVWQNQDLRQSLINDILKTSFVNAREVTFVGKSGRLIHSVYSGGIIQIDGIDHLLSVVRDLSEVERTERILRVRLALREYAAGHSTEALMIKALDEIEDLTDSQIGFYHFVEEDKGALSLQAWSTRTSEKFCKADAKGAHYGIEQAGVWADAIRERKPIVHNSYESLPNRKGLPVGHAAVNREVVVPTMRNDKIVAILGVGNKATEYSEADVSLIAFIADLVWTIVEQKRSDERIIELNRKLEQLAMTDDLTGMANRRAFFSLAPKEIQKAIRYKTTVSFIMLDLDFFKNINDSFGHDSGDSILVMVSDIIKSNVRDIDLAVRLGGEEFGVLMPNTSLSDALLSAERLRQAIEQAHCENREKMLRITVSIGVAQRSDSLPDLDALMRKADESLYRAKESGRNRVVSD
jgi:diguanylate cyclase (GGDEF)-like protein/PAS domain S-box-containing protein